MLTNIVNTLIILILISPLYAKPKQNNKDNFSKEEIIVLKNFIETKNKGQYEQAFLFLSKFERKLLVGPGDTYPQGVLRRLNALKLKDLTNNTEIRIENGKIIGVYKIFQTLYLKENPMGKLVLEHPSNKPVNEGSDSENDETENDDELDSNSSNESDRQLIDKVFGDFLELIAQGKFHKALELADPSEMELILGYENKLNENIKSLLKKIDAKNSSVLELENGKLQNIFLLMPVNQKGLEKAVDEFVNLIQKKNWPKALNMLTRYERNYLTDKEGTIKPEMALKLKDLKSSDYKTFYLFEDRLSGVLEWMGLGIYGQPKK